MCMLDNLENDEIVIEIKKLINNINDVKDEMNIYCDLMKHMFLSGSSQN